MCGISGIFTFNRDCGDAERAAVQAMNDRLVHRGPDDEGLYLSGPIALGHRRLSIIDLSNGKQPMANEDQNRLGGVQRRDLQPSRAAKRVNRQGAPVSHPLGYRSDRPSLRGSRRGDVQPVERHVCHRALGRAGEKLILARDRVGKKPLYYHLDNHRLAFASELKALLALDDCPARVDPDSLDHYLGFFFVPSPETIFSGVAKLEPASYLVCQDGKIRKERYWNADFGRRYGGTRQDAAAELTELLGDAVNIRLESEVPLGRS